MTALDDIDTFWIPMPGGTRLCDAATDPHFAQAGYTALARTATQGGVDLITRSAKRPRRDGTVGKLDEPPEADTTRQVAAKRPLVIGCDDGGHEDTHRGGGGLAGDKTGRRATVQSMNVAPTAPKIFRADTWCDTWTDRLASFEFWTAGIVRRCFRKPTGSTVSRPIECEV